MIETVLQDMALRHNVSVENYVAEFNRIMPLLQSHSYGENDDERTRIALFGIEYNYLTRDLPNHDCAELRNGVCAASFKARKFAKNVVI